VGFPHCYVDAGPLNLSSRHGEGFGSPFSFQYRGTLCLVLWFNRAGHVLRLRNYSRLKG
jgi:hypothetical protein